MCAVPPFGGSGASIRTLHIARALEQIGDLQIALTSNREWTDDQIERTKSEFRLVHMFRLLPRPLGGLVDRFRHATSATHLNTHALGVSDADTRILNQLLDVSNLTWIHTFKVANSLERFFWPSSVIDVDDYPSHFAASALPHAPLLVPKLKRLRDYFAWRRRESVWRNRFSALAVCKDSDIGHFGGGSRVNVVPNGFDVPEPARPRLPVSEAHCLGMIGDFAYLPNLDGVTWFVRTCWPAVRAAEPSATLRLVGKDSIDLARRLSSEGIVGLGYVADTGPEIASWSAMIVPTRLGGGTHLKVAEGLARKVPIVTTPHGARGYNLDHCRHAMIASDSVHFSKACINLLRDSDLRDNLTANGRELFEANYSPGAIKRAVEKSVEAGLAYRDSSNIELGR